MLRRAEPALAELDTASPRHTPFALQSLVRPRPLRATCCPQVSTSARPPRDCTLVSQCAAAWDMAVGMQRDIWDANRVDISGIGTVRPSASSARQSSSPPSAPHHH
eukprot:2594100-Pyramimonas_sp.AAC.1